MNSIIALLKRGTQQISISVLLILIVYIGHSSAVEVCKFAYKGTPNDLIDTTITVPDDMVAMSEYIYVNQPMSLDTPIDAPSIFFVKHYWN